MSDLMQQIEKREHTRTIAFTNASPFPYGGGVFSGKCIDGGKHYGKPYQIVIMNNKAFPKGARLPQPGDIWQVTGSFKPHPSNPDIWQLHVITCRMFKPNGKLFFWFLRNNKSFKGLYIGDKKWEAIFEFFKPTKEDSKRPALLKQALDDGNIAVFVDNGLLSAELAGRLISAYRTIDRNEINVVTYLQRQGIDHSMAIRLMKVWGKDTIKNIEANPYYLVAFIDKWKDVDELAQSVYGIAKDDSRRLVGGVLTVLKERLIEGKHTLTQHGELIRLLRLRLNTSTRSTLELAIEIAINKGVIVGSRETGYQLDGAEALERRVKSMLVAIHHDHIPRQQQIFTPPSKNFIDQVIASTEHELGFSFNKLQKDAVHMALNNRVSVLCGGAGCGKTAVLRAILNSIKAMNGKFYQMALAGRAAKRMTDLTGEKSFTIARFLHYAWEDEEIIDLAGDPFIIIDEASMLDLASMDRILRALYRGARLMFVGDEAQLPPISFGLVFHRLVKSKLIKHTRLIKVERSTDESGIADIAQLIREKQVPESLINAWLPWSANRKAIPGVFFESCSTFELNSKVRDIIGALNDHENTQLISIKTEGSGSTSSINCMYQDMLNESYLKEHKTERPRFTPNPSNDWDYWALGDKVMYLENDMTLGLNNGTLGEIIDIQKDTLICRFEDVANPIVIKPESLEKITLAFSITCHKAQGSQFKRIIIPIVDVPALLDNAWVYTALTRGIEQVIFVGDWSAFAKAVKIRSNVECREIGFNI